MNTFEAILFPAIWLVGLAGMYAAGFCRGFLHGYRTGQLEPQRSLT